MNYQKLKEKHEKIINDFPIFYAFGKDQFKEGLKKLDTTEDKILSIGYGGFIRKSDRDAYIKMFKDIDKEEKEALKDDKFLYDAFKYELANHEFCITYDYTDTLEVFGFKEETLTDNQRSILIRARNDYLMTCEDF